MKRLTAAIVSLLLTACTLTASPPDISDLRVQPTYCGFDTGIGQTRLEVRFTHRGGFSRYDLYWTPAFKNGQPPTSLEDFSEAERQKVSIPSDGRDENLSVFGSGTFTTELFLAPQPDGKVKAQAVSGEPGRVWVKVFNSAGGSNVLMSGVVEASDSPSCDP